MAQLTETTMSLGDLTLGLDYSEDLVEALDFYNHVLLYKDGVRYGPPMVLLRKTVSKEGIGIGCRSSEWWLGLDKDGPVIEDTEFLACTNKLSNGSFELLDILGDPLYWTRSELSKWLAVLSGGVEVASVTADSGDAKDDVLRSEESFEALAGHSHAGSVQIARTSGAVGLLRLRHVYEGRFDHPNLIVNPGFESGYEGWGFADFIAIASDAPSEARTGSGVMQVLPIDKPQLAVNPEFTSGTGWTLPTGIVITGGAMVLGPSVADELCTNGDFESGEDDWSFDGLYFEVTNFAPYTGSNSLEAKANEVPLIFAEDFDDLTGWTESVGEWAATTDEAKFGTYSASPTTYDHTNADLGGLAYLTGPLFEVRPGDRLRAEGWIKALADDNDASGEGAIQIGGTGVDDAIVMSATPRGEWVSVTEEFDVVDEGLGTRDVNFELQVRGRAFSPNEQWYFDSLSLKKIRGNRAQAVHDNITVTPGQSYRLRAAVLAGWTGALVVRASLVGTGETINCEERVQATDENDWKLVEIDVRPDEGYTVAIVNAMSEDIFPPDGAYIDVVSFKQTDNVIATATETGTIAVSAGTTYRLAGQLISDADVKDGDITIGVILSGAGMDDVIVNASQGPTKGQLVEFFTDVRVDEGYTTAKRFVEVKDAFTGSYSLEFLTFVQTDNNRDRITMTDTIAVTPERTYGLKATARSEVGLFRGNVKFSALLTSTGRPDVTIESSPIEGTEGEWVLSDFSLNPPSGYDACLLSVVATDTEGGFFWIDDLSLVDQDSGSVVYDAKSAATGSETLALETTAPTGTERVHVELVAESQAGGWTADLATFARVGTVAQAADIVAALLGTDVGVTAGTIHNAGPILYDWHIRNLTHREALRHLSRAGLVLPHREWRITEDNELDWGLPSELFEDRTDLFLSNKDLELLGEPDVEENVETQVSRVKVVGADRQRPDRTHVQITGEATSAITGTNYYGQPVSRPRIIENSQADHRGYAEGLAQYEAERNRAKQSVRVRLSDPAALGRMFKVGDWVYVHFPEAGFEDLSNPKDSAGQTVYPQKVRVLSRTTQMGPGFRAELHRPNEDPIDLPVNWEQDTTIEIEIAPGDGLGGLQDEFAADPQGPASGNSFLSYRASAAR